MQFTIKKHFISPIVFLVFTLPFIQGINNVCYGQRTGSNDWNFNLLDEDYCLKKIDELTKEDQSDEGNVEWIISCLPVYGENAARHNSEKIKSKLLDFPVNNSCVGASKVFALQYIMHMEGVIDYILSQLSSDNPGIQRSAARAVIKYGGEWNLVEPIIRKNEMYGVLGVYRVTEAIPPLQEAVKSGSWNGKINAAYALRELGFPDVHKQTAEDILKNAPISNDRLILRPVHMAITIARKEQMTYLAPDIYRFNVTDNSLVSGDAVSVLMSFVVKDFSSEAELLLERLVKETSNETLKKRVIAFLKDNENRKK